MIIFDIFQKLKKDNKKVKYRINFFLTFFILLVFLLFKFTSYVFAESNYVLPYPSIMPGSMLYKLSILKEEILKYWYYGDFGQFSYSLKLSDKYLVEAKTLFEYKQYLLGKRALEKSDYYFQNVKKYLLSAQEERRQTRDKELILVQAGLKHIEILQNIEKNSPKTINWVPEKEKATRINIQDLLENSKRIRSKYL